MSADDLRLGVAQLRRVCDPASFPFEDTSSTVPLEDIIGQDRAVKALEFGLDISSSGFNLFLAGQPGVGKTTILKRVLERVVKDRPVPDDIAYVQNFDDPDSPCVLTLPAGRGSSLRTHVEEFVEDLKERVPKAFEGKQYEEQKRTNSEAHQKKRQKLIEGLEGEARDQGFEIKNTPMGLRTIAVQEDKPITPDEYQAMEDDARGELDAKMEELQKRIRDVMAEVKEVEQALKADLKDLNQQVAMNVIGGMMHDLHREYRDLPDVISHLDLMQADILSNIDDFRTSEEQQLPIPGLRMQSSEPDLARYQVNLIVDNSDLKGAPVVVERNPTYPNLIGRIERRAQFGALITDFTMIRAGSLLKANGGYLVLDVEDVLRNQFVYDALKRSLMNKEARIEDIAERFGMFSVATLRPRPVPLRVKVCLTGNPHYYHMLFAYDEVFREIFKVKADFDSQADRTDDAEGKFGAFIARLVVREDLPHFHRGAVAAVVEESSRLVEDQEKLSLRFGQVNDLIREAAYWAQNRGAENVEAADVERAVEEAEYRSSLSRERVQDLIQRNVLRVDTDGCKVGEINGLAVHMLGDYLFGRPSKISATVHLGREGVMNIERRVQLSHSTHDKGVIIFGGFLGERFAQDQPLTLSAAIAFEQSYGEISGDSASSTELYVLLSALSGIPIKQGIAVTGSVNQKGDVQAIGGVNHKIEGFFDICDERGLTGDQGVMIPQANVQNLMLRQRVIDAVEAGKFHIWSVEHVDQGIEILTGVPAGTLEPCEAGGDGDANRKSWAPDSINGLVAARLRKLGKQLTSWSREAKQPSAEIVSPSEGATEQPPPPMPPRGPCE